MPDRLSTKFIVIGYTLGSLSIDNSINLLIDFTIMVSLFESVDLINSSSTKANWRNISKPLKWNLIFDEPSIDLRIFVAEGFLN